METLKPVEISESYIKQISNGMKRYFKEYIFDEIFNILKDNTIYNSKSDIINALKSGKIYYADGAFRTEDRFSNTVATSLESYGAYYRNGAYYIERSKLPMEIETTLSLVSARDAEKVQAVNNLLFKLSASLSDVQVNAFIEKAVEKTFKKLETDILKTAEEKRVPTIGFEPTNKQAEQIARDYIHNMDYWVKKWEAKEIAKMRQDVQKMVLEGARTPTVAKYFEQRWGVASNKAEFLAINETHLAGSIIKATRYQEMGFTHFKWGRSSSKEKRKLHEEYYGKVFAYNEPPIIDEQLNINGLPRQIWNCKCHAQPVINSSFFENATRIKNAKRNFITKAIYKIKNSKQRHNNPWRYRRYGEGQEV